MKLSVVSSKKKVDGELGLIVSLFENGLEVFHLRKNHYSKSKLKRFLKGIPKKYHSKIILHSHQILATRFKLKGVHFSTREVDSKFYVRRVRLFCKLLNRKASISRSFDNLSDLISERKYYDFVVLNPVFDSVSDDPTATSFSHRAIKSSLDQTGLKVAALGGVNSENLSLLKEFGFSEAILNRQIWNNNKRVGAFLEAKAIVERLNDPEHVRLRKVAN